MENSTRSINNYYIKLEYGICKQKALKDIRNLSLSFKFQDGDNFSQRLKDAASIMKENFLLFASVCEHKDVVTDIIDYFRYFSIDLIHGIKGEYNDVNEIITSIMLTIYGTGLEPEIVLFLENAIVENSILKHITMDNYRTLLTTIQSINIILFEESDLYAFFNCFNIKHVSCLKKIWIQESIKKDFQWHVKKYFGRLNIPIHIFRLEKEIFVTDDLDRVGILSIWSEDIAFAKNLAMSFKKHVIFINAYMNFCSGILLSYAKLLYLSETIFKDNYTDSIDAKYKCLTNPKMDKNPVYSNCYNLFYRGTWHKPERAMYWEQNNVLIANATCEDAVQCKQSAAEGFKIWSALSIQSRMNALSRLASVLECKNESLLAKEVLKWSKLPYFYLNLLTCHKTEQYEITKIRQAKGIIILEEKEDKVTMFCELTQCLITGNSVIVICKNWCTLAFYCDMFSTADIPPGVINVLSSKILEVQYDDLTNLKPEEIYTFLTINKHIIVPLK